MVSRGRRSSPRAAGPRRGGPGGSRCAGGPPIWRPGPDVVTRTVPHAPGRTTSGRPGRREDGCAEAITSGVPLRGRFPAPSGWAPASRRSCRMSVSPRGAAKRTGRSSPYSPISCSGSAPAASKSWTASVCSAQMARSRAVRPRSLAGLASAGTPCPRRRASVTRSPVSAAYPRSSSPVTLFLLRLSRS